MVTPSLERNTPMRLILLLPLALAACVPPQPQMSPADRHALSMLKRGYSEWVVRCAWAYGRFHQPLFSALRRCQLDLGQDRNATIQTKTGIELAPTAQNGHIRKESAKPHISREAYTLDPTAAY
ncbi:MAG: hypothetical protein OC190_05835 [Novosphingobium aromaticivorans]|nr:hypothetical protein [Novosphingobium aromaticivorans]